MFGALTGVLLLGVVSNLLTLAQVPSFCIQVIYGAIVLGSLMVARFAGGRSQEQATNKLPAEAPGLTPVSRTVQAVTPVTLGSDDVHSVRGRLHSIRAGPMGSR